MKLPIVLLGVALVTGALQAETVTATAAPAQVDPKAVSPAVKTDPKTKVDPKKKKEEAMGVIKGTEIARSNGTFLGLEVINSNFKLTFYDKKKKPMAIDVTRATARWPNRRTAMPANFHTVLNGGGTALVGGKPVLPPFPFTVHLVLLKGEGDDAKAVEQYDVTYAGS